MKNVYEVLRRPLITEKSTALKETQRTLGFEVHRDATKPEIKKAVETLFGVKVERVNIIKVQPKPKRRGLYQGTRPGWKKAIVQLREGDTIDVFEGAQV